MAIDGASKGSRAIHRRFFLRFFFVSPLLFLYRRQNKRRRFKVFHSLVFILYFLYFLLNQQWIETGGGKQRIKGE